MNPDISAKIIVGNKFKQIYLTKLTTHKRRHDKEFQLQK